MPRKIVVRVTWDESHPPDMASFAHGVADALRNNTETFQTPDVSPDDLDAAANRVDLAYARRMNGPAAKTELEEADTALDDLLHTEATYVSGVAKGNKATIQLSTFVPTSDVNTPATAPATPGAARISGNAAELSLIIDAVPGATSYCWLIFLDAPVTATVGSNYISLPAARVIIIPNGHARETLRNIIPAGTKISVQVMAQNAAGKSAFSALVSLNVGGL